MVLWPGKGNDKGCVRKEKGREKKGVMEEKEREVRDEVKVYKRLGMKKRICNGRKGRSKGEKGRK